MASFICDQFQKKRKMVVIKFIVWYLLVCYVSSIPIAEQNVANNKKINVDDKSIAEDKNSITEVVKPEEFDDKNLNVDDKVEVFDKTEQKNETDNDKKEAETVVAAEDKKETDKEEESTENITVLPEVHKTYLINNSTNNNTAKDLYVIRTIVYEVGILTDASNDTTEETESHEEIDLTFFDPHQNGSVIDLSNIPVPIQTNISGVSITGIAPLDFGTIHLPENDNETATLKPNFPLQVPILPSAVITVKHNISTVNDEKQAELFSNLPNLLGLTSPITGEPLKIETSTETKANEVQSTEEKTKEKKEDKDVKVEEESS